MVKYSREPLNASKAAKALGVDLRTSFKNTWNVAAAIKGMQLEAAKSYLAAVLQKKRCIPIRKFTGCAGRTAQAKEFKHTQGRWPEKSVKAVIGLLKNAESNAEFKNLDTENLVVQHISCNRAVHGRRRTYRAHGRISAYKSSPVHIEIILQEEEEDVEKPEDNKTKKFTKKQIAKQRLGSAN
jgi:large subunit ribosomal protein L17e